MSATKIKYHEAYDIAQKIAAKAFEHLTGPLEAKEDAFFARAYACTMEALDIAGREKVFIDAGVLVEADKAPFYAPTETEHTHYSRTRKYFPGDGCKVLAPFNGAFIICDPLLRIDWAVLEAEKEPVTRGISALADELRDQMKDKSARHVMKTWPEAAPFVAAYFAIDEAGKDVSMTRPLEQLLSKYLMPLPAAPQQA